MEIIPAILPESFKELEEKVARLAHLRDVVSVVHLDVCDGQFVPPRSWPYTGDTGEFAKISKEEEGLPHWQELDFEVHLMVSSPRSVVEKWAASGAIRIVVHLETLLPEEAAEFIHEWGHVVEIGVALNLSTPLDACESFLHEVKVVQLMGISRVGYQGQQFDPGTIARVRALRERYPDHIISVDGGVSLDNAGDLIAAGASRLVVGSTLWKSGDVRFALERFKTLF